jgi:hypothetical protein
MTQLSEQVAASKAWADQFKMQAKMILGTFAFKSAPTIIDMDYGIDLEIIKSNLNIGLRTFQHFNIEEWNHILCIRDQTLNGQETELEKLMNYNRVNYFFQIHVGPQILSDGILYHLVKRSMLIDLDVLRTHYNNAHETRKIGFNKDIYSKNFHCIKIEELPENVLVYEKTFTDVMIEALIPYEDKKTFIKRYKEKLCQQSIT